MVGTSIEQALWRCARCALVAFVVTGATNASAQVELEDVPATVGAGRAAAASGAIDRDMWYRLEPYYTDPVCVPCGGLSDLRTVVPEIAAELPADTSTLSRYAPWQAEDIQRFLRDYPAVAGMLPLLSFAVREQRLLAASLSMRGLIAEEASPAFLRVEATPATGLRAGARARFSGGAGRWQSRGAVFESNVAGLRVAIGSFLPRLASDLSSGRFCAPDSAASAWEQFAYGPGSAWNGGLVGWENRSGTVQTEVFGHLDVQRTVVSGQVQVRAGHHAVLGAGAVGSGSAAEVPHDGWLNLRGSAYVRGIHLSAQAVVPVTGGVSGGYSIDARIELDSARGRLRVDYFPSVAGAPDGQRAWRALAMLDSARGQVVFADISASAKVAGVASVQSSIQYASSAQARSCRAHVLVSMGRRVRTDIRLMHVPDLAGSASGHQTRAGVNLTVWQGDKGTLGLESVLTYRYDRGWVAGCAVQEGMRLGPVEAGLRVGMRVDSEGAVGWDGAVEQELRLGRGLYGVVRVEAPLDKGWQNGAIVGGAIRVAL